MISFDYLELVSIRAALEFTEKETSGLCRLDFSELKKKLEHMIDESKNVSRSVTEKNT